MFIVGQISIYVMDSMVTEQDNYLVKVGVTKECEQFFGIIYSITLC